MSSFCLPSGNLFSRVVVPCSLFKKVLLLVDLLFKQLPRNNYPGQIVCRWRGSWHELRRARGTILEFVQERGRGRCQVATKCCSQFCHGTALGVLFQRRGRRWAGRWAATCTRPPRTRASAGTRSAASTRRSARSRPPPLVRRAEVGHLVYQLLNY